MTLNINFAGRGGGVSRSLIKILKVVIAMGRADLMYPNGRLLKYGMLDLSYRQDSSLINPRFQPPLS